MRRNTGHDKDVIMFFRFLDIVGTVKKNVVTSIERLGDGGLERSLLSKDRLFRRILVSKAIIRDI